MTHVHPSIDALRGRRPEWEPWLAVVNEATREAATSRWESAVPDSEAHTGSTGPWLAGATIFVDPDIIRRYAGRLLETASRSGTAKMATLKGAAKEVRDPLALFAASLRRDRDVSLLATVHAADPEAFQAVVSLIAWPFLQACHRRWSSSLGNSWAGGHCPVCAAWPAFAEVRGIERSRYRRCGCGAAWLAQPLVCTYCGNSDHDELRSLVPENPDRAGSIEACCQCRGYLKVFTRLQGCAPAAVMLEDLASVDLDVAAIEQGYVRPSALACRLEITVLPAAATGSFLSWNA